jgi:hypothetical protein
MLYGWNLGAKAEDDLQEISNSQRLGMPMTCRTGSPETIYSRHTLYGVVRQGAGCRWDVVEWCKETKIG